MSETKKKTEDEVLDFTQLKREEIFKALTQNGIPSNDPKILGLALATLDGMDRAALTKKRIETESNLGDKTALLQASVTQLLTDLRTNKNKSTTENKPVERAPVELPKTDELPMIVEGELDTAPVKMDVSSLLRDDQD